MPDPAIVRERRVARRERSPRSLWLASSSPRRLALLRQIGHEPYVVAATVDETPRAEEAPCALVRRLATAKARAAPLTDSSPSTEGERVPDGTRVVLAADTVIDLDGRSLGKPVDRADGIAMLLALGGRTHRVLTGLCVRRECGTHTIVVVTHVRFGRVRRAAAARYWDGGEPVGKAGGYAIQGEGARFVASLAGSYSNVVGLPLHETARLLAAAGIEPDRSSVRSAVPTVAASDAPSLDSAVARADIGTETRFLPNLPRS